MATNPVRQQVLSTGILEHLEKQFGKRFSVSEAVRQAHGKDESYHPSKPPDAVVTIHSEKEVQDVVHLCKKHSVPIVAYGAGTSLEGQVAALQGGICIDFNEFNAILDVHAEDLDAVVQPGVRRKQMNHYLRDSGLFFPVDPGADATIGGMASTRASGTNAVRYGTMRENVISMNVVLADGRLIRTGSRSKKSASGYDLTRLFVGSEGTLGLITRVTVRLYGVPETIVSAICNFPTLEDAVNTAILTIQSGIPVARIELLDDRSMQAINAYSKTNYAIAPTLFLEFHGSKSSVAEQTATVQGIASDFSGSDFQWSSNTEERNRLWAARHDAAYATKALIPEGEIWATDVCVPISRLADCILQTKRDIEESGIPAPIVGHVGDGNFHLTLLPRKGDAEQFAKAEALHERMVQRALSMDGTCTGEHGIGYGKLQFMQAEHGNALQVMASIKAALDPDNIFNPGKILP